MKKQREPEDSLKELTTILTTEISPKIDLMLPILSTAPPRAQCPLFNMLIVFCAMTQLLLQYPNLHHFLFFCLKVLNHPHVSFRDRQPFRGTLSVSLKILS
jgi:hypothetical protein